jgi:hypothetical protein
LSALSISIKTELTPTSRNNSEITYTKDVMRDYIV